MDTYLYSAEIVNGKYTINPSNRLDENGKQIFLENDISSRFPSSGFSVDYSETGIAINFDNILSSEEQVILNSVVNDHKNFTISKLNDIHQNWKSKYTDYKSARADMGYQVAVSGWSNMTSIEKKIASQWFVVGAAQRNEVYTIEEQSLHGKTFNANSIVARQKRYQAAVSEVYNRLQKSEINVIISEIPTMSFSYINYGREGTTEGDGEGFFDYLYGRSGSCYAGSGFINKPYAPSGLSMSGLTDKIMKVFKSGIYP